MIQDIHHPRLDKRLSVKDLRKIFHHYHASNGTGEKQLVECVEFTVVGNGREWGDFLTLADFAEANPTIDLKNLPRQE